MTTDNSGALTRGDVDEEQYYGLGGDDIPSIDAGYYCNAKRVRPEQGFVGYCKNRAGYKTDHVGEGRCRYHGGNAEPQVDHPDWGQGAPEGNVNGLKHGLHANRTNFYHNLDGERQMMVDEFEEAMIQRYQEFNNRQPDPADVQDLFEIAVGYVLRDYARDWLVDQMEDTDNPMLEHVTMSNDDGSTTEFDKPNSILEHIEDNRREDRQQRKAKGLEQGPDEKAAEGIQSIAQVLSEQDSSEDADE